MSVFRVFGLFILLSVLGCAGCAIPQAYNKNIRARKEKMAVTYIQLGLAYLKYGNSERAHRNLEIALALAPDYSAAWSAMGYYYESIHNPVKAQGYYIKGIKVDPENSAAAHNNYGTFLCRQGRYKASIFEFLQAAENDQYLKASAAYENASYCASKIPNKKLAALYMKKAMNFSSVKSTNDMTTFE